MKHNEKSKNILICKIEPMDFLKFSVGAAHWNLLVKYHCLAVESQTQRC